MATIKDVARLAGVSVSTVSRVLNKSGYVNEETETKVLRAIEQLQYKPSQIARGLVSRKTKTLGLILPDITNPFFPELARAVEDTAQRHEYTVILCNSDNQLQKEEKYFQLLQEKCVDGIIIAGEVNSKYMSNIIANGTPIVVVDGRMEDSPVHSIYTNNRFGGKLAVHHLVSQGYKQIAHIRGPIGTSSADDRYEAYKEALEELKIPYQSILVQPGDFRAESGYEAMKRLLALANPPDAVFAANDLMALGALEAIAEAELNVPGDIGVVGFDGIPLTKVVQPKLTTIQQPIYEMGVLAAESLIKHIHQPTLEKKNIVLEPSLIIRKTSLRGDSFD
ncbi:LacI family transcriptional regulator [Microaerobacter geothermalis]|uniref:LacI family DNA-binding transcriptional regulator n=1 Tax=Microaerobacter geothermalis TaxID=674972 RepID=UPI001F3B2DA5|nr:LacI family DNA-binding transcriptional regulator [Microaerobacter geothermalis]MCF6093790.1 LacI family transcriptional regulator [Microaerobacter geothermalis]